MSEPATNDIDRALASLGSSGIGYRKFRPQIELAQPDAEWVDASPAAMGAAEAEFPLLTAVFPGARFERSDYALPLSPASAARDLEPVDTVAPERASGPQHDLSVDRATRPVDASPAMVTEAALALTVPKRQAIRLTDMFRTLRDGAPPAELTMAQLQDVFRRL